MKPLCGLHVHSLWTFTYSICDVILQTEAQFLNMGGGGGGGGLNVSSFLYFSKVLSKCVVLMF